MIRVVVSGTPRSGTSLMMRIIKELGVTVPAEPFTKYNPSRDLNPCGYYELPLSEFTKGFNPHRYYNCGVKIWPAFLKYLKPQFVSKAIFCFRDSAECIPSIYKLLKTDSHIYGIDPRSITKKTAVDVYEKNAELAIKLMDRFTEHTVVPFATLKRCAADTVYSIANFLQIDDSERIKNAIKLVEV